jgi:ribosomal protein S12 methylthiotransferase accessory factor YcaO
MTNGPCSVESGERSAQPDVAIALAAREIARLGLTSAVRRLGAPPTDVFVTQLVGSDGVRAVGGGKGGGREARAGADFEALERFFTASRGNTRFGADLGLVPLAGLAAQPALAVDRVVQRWARCFPERSAAASPYGVVGPGAPVRYPLFLHDPAYYADPMPGDDAAACRTFLRYTSSIGTAAGVNPIDARLHALCELVEHDGISHALLRWFVTREGDVAVVHAADLPPDLRRLHTAATGALGSQVLLVDVTTELGVPTYLAIADVPGSPVSARGAGASPSGRLAAARALRELLQGTHLDPDAAAVDRRLRALAPWPVLVDSYCLSAQRLAERTIRRVRIAADPPDIDTPSRRLGWLDARLAAHAITTFFRELAPAGSLVSVIAALAPALDRFSLVLHGVPVVPTGRGHRLWAG